MPDQAYIPDDVLNDPDLLSNLEDIIQSFAFSLDLDEALKASLGKILEYTSCRSGIDIPAHQ